MPNPDLFYDRDGITIWHGDNADVDWPTPDEVGLLLTDPPYGIGFVALERATPHAGRGVVGDDRPFSPSPLLAYSRAVLWGANYYASELPPSGWIVWDKRTRDLPDNGLGEAEVAWTSLQSRITVFRHMWNGTFRASERGHWLHPTQKPVALMRWLVVKWTEPGDLVFDPYMGSGPVAQACLELGRRYFGIELVEEYCQAAVDRLNRTTPSMFEVADAQS